MNFYFWLDMFSFMTRKNIDQKICEIEKLLYQQRF
jgi:hypothetical protein